MVSNRTKVTDREVSLQSSLKLELLPSPYEILAPLLESFYSTQQSFWSPFSEVEEVRESVKIVRVERKHRAKQYLKK